MLGSGEEMTKTPEITLMTDTDLSKVTKFQIYDATSAEDNARGWC